MILEKTNEHTCSVNTTLTISPLRPAQTAPLVILLFPTPESVDKTQDRIAEQRLYMMHGY